MNLMNQTAYIIAHFAGCSLEAEKYSKGLEIDHVGTLVSMQIKCFLLKHHVVS